MAVEALRCEVSSPLIPVWFGDTVRLGAVFTEIADGSGRDPDEVVLTLRAPDGSELTFNTADLVRSSAGVFYKDVEMNQSGVWRYRYNAQSGGTHVFAVNEGQVTVKASGVISG